MRLRNLIREDTRRSVARKVPYLRNGGSKEYDALKLTPESIEELEQARPDRHAVKAMPHKKGGGIEAAIDLLKASHPMTGSSTSNGTGAHSFEMQNVDEEIQFQFVMSEEKYQDRLARQLETYYPDSHVEKAELPEPDLLPLYEGWHLSMAHLELRLQSNAKQRYYPIKHIDVEGFDNDPFGSITREMVGEPESENITNVAIQVMFQPAPNDWYKGGLRAPSIDDAADELTKKDEKEASEKDVLKSMFSKGGMDMGDFVGGSESKGKETAASRAVRDQRGHKGFSINVRIIAAGESPEDAIARVDETADMFIGYYDSDTEQGFTTIPLDGKQLLHEAQLAYRRDYVDRGITMGERGAAALVHMPNKDSHTRNVTFSHTSNAGDVPPDQPRFADFDQTGWDMHDRSVTMNPDRWNYAIQQRQPTEAELERARQIAEENENGEIA